MSTHSALDPADFAAQTDSFWDHARRDYLAGMTAAQVCQRYDISLSSFRLHARVGGWRRMDQPASEIPPEPGEYHPDDEVSFADLADQAFLNIRRALGGGRAAEAASWMRLYDKLADRARAQVMAVLPDASPPRGKSGYEPLRLASSDDAIASDLNEMAEPSETEPQRSDSLHPIFFGSNPLP